MVPYFEQIRVLQIFKSSDNQIRLLFVHISVDEYRFRDTFDVTDARHSA